MGSPATDYPKHILITGASSGIGAALAQEYARTGVMLALQGRDEERLKKVAETCRTLGAAVHTALIDVTEREALQDWITETDDRAPLDLVIANAGISGGSGGKGPEPVAQARRIFDVNLTGILNTIEPILPRMQERKGGQVALMSSLASFSGWAGAPAYSGSKGAVRLYGEALRGNMKAYGVKVNVLCPGFIRTPLTDENPYPMPFLMDVDRAARIIVKGLACDRGRIAFPWPTYLLAGFFGLLPHWLSLKFFSRLPAKPQQR